MESTSPVYVHGCMYWIGVDKHFDKELTGHMSMDGLINATNEHRQIKRKNCRNATYFKPRSEFVHIHYKES